MAISTRNYRRQSVPIAAACSAETKRSGNSASRGGSIVGWARGVIGLCSDETPNNTAPRNGSPGLIHHSCSHLEERISSGRSRPNLGNRLLDLTFCRAHGRNSTCIQLTSSPLSYGYEDYPRPPPSRSRGLGCCRVGDTAHPSFTCEGVSHARGIGFRNFLMLMLM